MVVTTSNSSLSPRVLQSVEMKLVRDSPQTAMAYRTHRTREISAQRHNRQKVRNKK